VGLCHTAGLGGTGRGVRLPAQAIGSGLSRVTGRWQGSLICDDDAGYKAGFTQGIREVGCWAHAGRKFHELLERNQNPIAERALATIGALHEIERATADGSPEHRRQVREDKARPMITAFHEWLIGQRSRLTSSTHTAKAIDYALNRWEALVRYLDDGRIPIDNNWVENQIRPWALGRKNWLFAGSVRSGQRAANVMTLIQSAKVNGSIPRFTSGMCWSACPPRGSLIWRRCCRTTGR
jgi:transposase